MLDQRSLVAVAYRATINMQLNASGHSSLRTHLTADRAGSCCSTPILVTQGAEELIDVKSVQNLF